MSVEYIKREDAVDACFNGWGYDEPTIRHIQENLNRIPAAPVRPAVRATWKGTGFIEKSCLCKGCSSCGEIAPVGNFCNVCGADMRAEEGEA